MKCIIHNKTGNEIEVTNQQAKCMVLTGLYKLKRGANDNKHTTKPSIQSKV